MIILLNYASLEEVFRNQQMFSDFIQQIKLFTTDNNWEIRRKTNELIRSLLEVSSLE
jgi:hypothetical protein